MPGVTQSDEAAGPLQVVEPICLLEGLSIINGAFAFDHRHLAKPGCRRLPLRTIQAASCEAIPLSMGSCTLNLEGDDTPHHLAIRHNNVLRILEYGGVSVRP